MVVFQDPIEVSALRMVMQASKPGLDFTWFRQERPSPILNTSAKTNLGHLEASAGMAGVLKCVNILNSSTCPANNHLSASGERTCERFRKGS